MANFGWSYPPGAANDPSAPWNQSDGPCECCGLDTDACICPECPVCGDHGNPQCYNNSQRKPWHGLTYNSRQLIGQAKLRIADLKSQIADEELFIEMETDKLEGREP